MTGVVSSPIDLCDALLGEVARREHRFSWLRVPGGEDWLAVDAYYPGNRVVVAIAPDAEAERVCRELVPQNGLYLVVLPAAEIVQERDHLQRAVGEGLSKSGWTPRPAPQTYAAQEGGVAALPPPAPAPSTVRTAAGTPAPSPAASAPSPGASAPSPGASAPSPAADAEQRFGMLIAVLLVVVVWVEAYLGVDRLALAGNHIVLGFGLVLDACARVIGTIAAAYAGDHQAAWRALIVGSPQVAYDAYATAESTSRTEPATLAGLASVAAIAVLAAGLLLLALGS
jgi:hypothetical protein